MSTTLITLIGPTVERSLIEKVRTLVSPWGPVTTRNWTPPQAVDDLELVQFFSPGPVPELRESLAAMVKSSAHRGVDLFITPSHLLEPSPVLLVSDVDSTLIKEEVIELIAQRAGSFEAVAEVTDRAMRGDLDFSQSLIERVKTLRGVHIGVLTDVLNEVCLSNGVRSMCSGLRDNQHFTGVVSGGFIEVVQPLADSLNIDFARANQLETQDELLTGEVKGEIVSPDVKAQMLRRWASQAGVSMDRTIAVGDGANDLLMLQEAELGIAFNAKPIVSSKADISISSARLDVILTLVAAK